MKKTSNNLSDMAYCPDELKQAQGKLTIDTDWYNMQQLMPPITRLIEHIDGITIDFVASCLGIDPKKYKFHSSTGENGEEGGNEGESALPEAYLRTETQSCLKERSIARLLIECPFCFKSFEFLGVQP